MAQGPNFNENGQFYFMYAHLLERNVQVGDEVKAGDEIGKTGTSGFSTTRDPHLHFEVLNVQQAGGMSNRVNPGYYVNYKLPENLQSDENTAQHDVAISSEGDPQQGDPLITK
jgi:murein DD-endopeptidase MepM/ murein hydrolase activator NlpD